MSDVPPGWRERYKPAASVRTQLRLAGALWSAVGLGLSVVAVLWLREIEAPARLALFLGAGVAIGLAKGVWVMDRSARRTVGRIRERGDGRCLGGFLSPASWLMVGAMMGLGRGLRLSPLPRNGLGLLYLAVGVALLVGSLRFWSAARKS